MEFVILIKRNDKMCNQSNRTLLLVHVYIFFYTDGLWDITAYTIWETRAFIDEGLQIRNLAKRKYRADNKRIKDPQDNVEQQQNVAAFLSMLSYCTETLLRQHVTVDDDDHDTEDAEYLLGPLPGELLPQSAALVGEFLCNYLNCKHNIHNQIPY